MSHHGSILVIDEILHETRVDIGESTLTGRQVVAAAGHPHVDQYFVLIRVDGGGLRELNQNEHVEVCADGSSAFYVIKSDRLYRFEIEESEYVWPISPIVGRILYSISGANAAESAIWLKGDDKRIIEPDDQVDLGGHRVEKLEIKRRKHLHTIYINGNKHEVKEDQLNGAQIKARGEIESDYQLFLEQPGDDKLIANDYSVKIEDNQHFYSLPPATFG